MNANTASLAYLQLKNDLTRSLVEGFPSGNFNAQRPLVRWHRNSIKCGEDGVWVGVFQTSSCVDEALPKAARSTKSLLSS